MGGGRLGDGLRTAKLLLRGLDDGYDDDDDDHCDGNTDDDSHLSVETQSGGEIRARSNPIQRGVSGLMSVVEARNRQSELNKLESASRRNGVTG